MPQQRAVSPDSAPPWTVRRATVDDAEAIEAVRIATWRACYRGYLPDAYLDSLTVTASRVEQYRQAIEDVESAERVIANSGAEVIGMGFAGPPENAEVDASVGELYALYVLPRLAGPRRGSRVAKSPHCRSARPRLPSRDPLGTARPSTDSQVLRSQRLDLRRHGGHVGPGVLCARSPLHSRPERIGVTCPRSWTLRPATLDDIEAFESVRVTTWKACFRGIVSDAFLDGLTVTPPRIQRCRNLIEDVKRSALVVACSGAEIIGMGMAEQASDTQLDADVCDVRALYVLPGWQGCGVGRALLERLTGHAALLRLSLRRPLDPARPPANPQLL